MSSVADTTLDGRIAALAARDLPLAVGIVREAVRLPADHVDRPLAEGGDPFCGLGNHEGPRIEYLRGLLAGMGAVESADDVLVDWFGNLTWTIEDPTDGMPRSRKRVVQLDGHCDTVRAVRARWLATTGVDPYLGATNAAALRRGALRREQGWLPPDGEWEHLLFGLGAADQLGGVAAMMVASRLLRELAPEGALRGVIVRGMVTPAEEDNEGGGPAFLVQRVLPGAPPEMLPDLVVLTEPSGDAHEGALGIYRGQRGRAQVEVTVTGRSSHGSVPADGLNPLEHGGAIVAEAARRAAAGEGLLDHAFLGPGTRTASAGSVETPSNCAVPQRFTFRFDRRLTVGESAAQAVAEIESLASVSAARAAGLTVEIAVPRYEQPTWSGYAVSNPEAYPAWLTPEDHPAVGAAVAAYRAVVSPHVTTGGSGGALRVEPRVGRCPYSTNGVGYVMPANDTAIDVPGDKRWVRSGDVRHPAMLVFGPGILQNVHRIGECLDTRELRHAIAFLTRLPSLFARGVVS